MKRLLNILVLALFLVPAVSTTLLESASALSLPTTGTRITDSLLERVAERAEQRKRTDQESAHEVGSGPVTAPVNDVNVTQTVESFRAEVVRLVNAERKSRGLSAYNYNSILEKSGQDYAVHMADTNCFSHTECGSTLKQRMHASGYYQGGRRSYSYGENIARGQKTAAIVMKDWMNSTSHRNAILSTKYLDIGIGKSGTYWVQHFGAIR